MSTDIRSPDDGRIVSPYASQRWLLGLLFVGHLGLYPILFGVSAVLLPRQLDLLDAENRVTNLGLVAGIAAAVGALTQPIAGAISDRSTSRFGRRRPFLLLGGMATAILLWLLGRAMTVPEVLLWWSLAMLAANVYQAALVAVVPDRVPRERRGTASSAIAATVPLGLILGLIVAVEAGPVAYLLLGALLAITAAVVVLGLREGSRPASPDRPQRRLRFLSSLAQRDFRFALLGRLLLFLGFLLVDNFLLYMLQSYAPLPPGWTAEEGVLALTLISAAGLLVTAAGSGWLSDRLGRRKPFAIVGTALFAIAAVPALVAPSWTTMVVFAVLGGLGFGCYYAVDTAIGTLVLPSDAHHARDMGVFNLGYVGSTIAGPVLGSVLVTATGGYAVLFVVGPVLAVAGALMILPIRSLR